MIKVGEHVTLDIIGTRKEYDPSFYEGLVHKIADKAKVTVLNIAKYKFEPQGFTLVALLAESHISFHTYPEKGIISFDFYTCGTVSPAIALEVIKKEIDHKRIIKKELNRDTISFYHDLTSTKGLKKNYLVKEVLEDLNNGQVTLKQAQLIIEKFWSGSLKKAVIDGDVEYGSLMAGQSVSMVKEIKTAQEIINEIVMQADFKLNNQLVR